ncbi:YlbF family regulator [Desertibacillus haloalkaliphilus]|uniref:YlbF family regulator n=1 Tax=Desertibacillus haloalkaliphilus TaxID=1328930 RepID=UPI001C257D87|nr:YlbF family regulator [Desertibacillus haloalkaliphilus]MBU8905431.1 YlbF family regulator [Desertibacillus haloalkaliphilus]
MSNMYDKAHELESALRESEEFQTLKELHDTVNNDESSKRMLDNFRNLQLELQQKQMQGVQITEEEAQSAQQQFELVQQHETISKLMEAEQRLSTVIGDINRIITEPLEDLYGKPE